jgi:hypothetical protein
MRRGFRHPGQINSGFFESKPFLTDSKIQAGNPVFPSAIVPFVDQAKNTKKIAISSVLQTADPLIPAVHRYSKDFDKMEEKVSVNSRNNR